jgi:tetratricopeptide (TPR) repeat protein
MEGIANIAALRELGLEAAPPSAPLTDGEKRARGAAAKADGNDACRRKEWSAALEHYNSALEVLGELAAASSAESDTQRSLDLVETVGAVHSNCALAHLKLSNVVRSIESADRAIACRPKWGKAHARRASALEAAGDIVEAHRSLYAALECDTASAVFTRGVARLARRARRLSALAAASDATRSLAVAGDDASSLSERHAACAELLRAGRGLPAATRDAHRFADSEVRLLELLELDAAIGALVTDDPEDAAPCRCLGTRLWMLRKAAAMGLDVQRALLREGGAAVPTRAQCATARGGLLEIELTPAGAAPTLKLLATDARGAVVARLRWVCGLASWLLLSSETSALPHAAHFVVASDVAGAVAIEEGDDAYGAGPTGRIVSELFCAAESDGSLLHLAGELGADAQPPRNLFEADE